MTDWRAIVGLAVLIVGLFAWLREDVTGDIGALQDDITALRGDVQAIAERVSDVELAQARQEGWLQALQGARIPLIADAPSVTEGEGG